MMNKINSTNKGTLTIVDDNHVILCTPQMEAPYSHNSLLQFEERAMNWLKKGGVLALPFPVDVTDLRSSSVEITASYYE